MRSILVYFVGGLQKYVWSIKHDHFNINKLAQHSKAHLSWCLICLDCADVRCIG